jgi:CubicO group peptidase (beta-lactamase class C family)
LAVLLGALAAAHVPVLAQVPPASFTDPDRRAKLLKALPRIEAMMAERAKDLAAPGFAYALVIDGEIVLQGRSGLRDVVAKAPVDNDTVFRIASMSKSFTAMAVLKLRDAGRLRLDDPVAMHVRELHGWRPATADSGPITIRQLLAHTAGLPEDNPQGDRTLAITPAEFSAWLRSGPPLARAAGSAFEYSNLGYALLGRVVGNVSGRRYQDYIGDEILRPLGMASTTYDPRRVPRERLAAGHRPARDDERTGEPEAGSAKGARADSDAWRNEPLLGDGESGAMGGVLTTAGDMARYIANFLAAWPPRDEPERGPVMRRTLREMQLGQGWPDLLIGRRVPGGRVGANALSYGFGLDSYVDCRWGRLVSHGGGLPGFGSWMMWLPDHGVGIVTLTNGTYVGGSGLAYEAFTLLEDSGALEPRQPQPAPALVRAAADAAALVDAWSDERATALAAENLFLDEPLALRRKAIVALREPMGVCRPGRLTPENPLRGKQRLDCDNGFIDIELTLAPTQPPRVQHLAASVARPLLPATRQAIAEMAAAIAGGAHRLLLAPKAQRTQIAAVLEATRVAYGSCRVDELLEGDGRDRATVRLACDRGRVDAAIGLTDGRLASVDIRRSESRTCLP